VFDAAMEPSTPTVRTPTRFAAPHEGRLPNETSWKSELVLVAPPYEAAAPQLAAERIDAASAIYAIPALNEKQLFEVKGTASVIDDHVQTSRTLMHPDVSASNGLGSVAVA